MEIKFNAVREQVVTSLVVLKNVAYDGGKDIEQHLLDRLIGDMSALGQVHAEELSDLQQEIDWAKEGHRQDEKEIDELYARINRLAEQNIKLDDRNRYLESDIERLIAEKNLIAEHRDQMAKEALKGFKYEPTDEEKALIREGKKIFAIKELRLRTGFGLKDCKDMVEAWAAQKSEPPTGSSSPEDLKETGCSPDCGCR